ncbi:helix-turn-helix domain-containing protein [Paenibacillus sp. TRM 82003]|nr:helix-turn-helix domain-containing protein [Paenibacillus sp. TRM 82003]
MKQLGQRLELAESTISGYENEIRRPDLELLIRLSELFDVSVDYLIGRSSRVEAGRNAVSETRETSEAYNVAILDGRVEALTEDEARHVKNSLEMFRLWKARRGPGEDESSP